MKKCIHCGEEFKRTDRSTACTTCKNGIYRYGLNKKQQLAIYEQQNRKCALCDDPIKMFIRNDDRTKCGYIDHSHETNKIRGILCHSCNTILGYFDKKGVDMKKIIEYTS